MTWTDGVLFLNFSGLQALDLRVLDTVITVDTSASLRLAGGCCSTELNVGTNLVRSSEPRLSNPRTTVPEKLKATQQMNKSAIFCGSTRC